MIKYFGSRQLALPVLLIEDYQPVLGSLATMIWIDLLFLANEGVSDWEEPLMALTGLSEDELQPQLEILEAAELIVLDADELTIKEPKLNPKTEPEVAVTSLDQTLDGAQKKKEAVFDYYHEKIGLMAAKDWALLNEWIEIRGMSPELVAKAIDVTAENAQFPSMKYLDGVLKNWFNAKIKDLEDLEQPKKSTPNFKANTPKAKDANPAYKSVDLEKVRKWKELFKDDYQD